MSGTAIPTLRKRSLAESRQRGGVDVLYDVDDVQPTHVLASRTLVPYVGDLADTLKWITCALPQHSPPRVVQCYTVESAGAAPASVLCAFCSLECLNAFELDAELVFSTILQRGEAAMRLDSADDGGGDSNAAEFYRQRDGR